MATGKELLAVAAREIGYRESAGKHNKYGAYYRMDGYAWCMFFVQWCYEQAGMKLPFFTGSCGELLRWYKANQPDCLGKEPVPGCIVIFDFPNTSSETDHTGLFVSRTDSTVTTIDGNTSGTNQSNGGWVQQKTRKLSYANPVYIVPRCLTEGDDMDITKLIKEMTPEQAHEIVAKAEAYDGLQAMPMNWNASEQLADAVNNGITDGTRPMAHATRLEAALMANRAAKAAAKSSKS